MKILGIESSCDETAFALYDKTQGLIGHVLHSQVELHALYEGVVPELASRDHIRRAIPLLKQLLSQANIEKSSISGIAYTLGPGLMGSLLVGSMLGRSLAYALNIPALGIHHLEAHLLAPMLEAKKPEYPFIALLVSGGHTLLAKVTQVGQYTILGETLDDAAGEAFDKTAKILGLGYPGGAVLAKFAETGSTDVFTFPRPMLDKPHLDFSFSGLKTAVLQTFQTSDKTEITKANIAASFQQAVVDTLINKSLKALKQHDIQQLVIAGGVSANLYLREQLALIAEKHSLQVYFPRIAFSTDNAAMVAYAGFLRFQAGQKDQSLAVSPKARWGLEELNIF